MSSTRFVSALIDPMKWFESLEDPPSLRWPLLLVVLTAGTNAIAKLIRYNEKAVAYRGDTTMAGAQLNEFVFGLSYWPNYLLLITINVLLGALGMFVLYVGILHLLSVAFGGTGSFRKTVAIVGWGYLPLLLGAVTWAILMFRITQTVPDPHFPTETRQWSLAIRSHPLYDLHLSVGHFGLIPPSFSRGSGSSGHSASGATKDPSGEEATSRGRRRRDRDRTHLFRPRYYYVVLLGEGLLLS